MELLVPFDVRALAERSLRDHPLSAAGELELRFPHQRLYLKPELLLQGLTLRQAFAVGGWAYLACADGEPRAQVWIQEASGRLSASVGRRGNERELYDALTEAAAETRDDVYLVTVAGLGDEALWLVNEGLLRLRRRSGGPFLAPEDEEELKTSWLRAAEYQQLARALARLQGLLEAVEDGEILVGRRGEDGEIETADNSSGILDLFAAGWQSADEDDDADEEDSEDGAAASEASADTEADGTGS